MRRDGRAEMFGTNVWNSNNINHSQLLMSARVSLCAGICVSVTQLLHLPGINPRMANQMLRRKEECTVEMISLSLAGQGAFG